MSALYAEIISYISSQAGVLPSMMKKHSSLGNRIAAWLTGEKPVLIIGGEPAKCFQAPHAGKWYDKRKVEKSKKE